MGIDVYGVSCCCSHHRWGWGWGWNLASSRVSIVYLVHINQVQSSYKSNSLTHHYSSRAPRDPKGTPNPNITQSARHILNDTSLAAVSLANGDRQSFFPDIAGLIRRAYRTASNSPWSTNSSLSIDTTAKTYRPLAVTLAKACSVCARQVLIKS